MNDIFLFTDSNNLRVLESDNNVSFFKKSTLLWLLNEKCKISNDRLQRYVHNQRRLDRLNAENVIQPITPAFNQKSFIAKDDHVIFRHGSNFILLEVLNFQYLFEKTLKKKRYSKSVCPTESEKPVGANGNCYLISNDLKLFHIKDSQYWDVKNYLCHTDKSYYNIKENTYSDKIFDYLKSI